MLFCLHFSEYLLFWGKQTKIPSQSLHNIEYFKYPEPDQTDIKNINLTEL